MYNHCSCRRLPPPLPTLNNQHPPPLYHHLHPSPSSPPPSPPVADVAHNTSTENESSPPEPVHLQAVVFLAAVWAVTTDRSDPRPRELGFEPRARCGGGGVVSKEGLETEVNTGGTWRNCPRLSCLWIIGCRWSREWSLRPKLVN